MIERYINLKEQEEEIGIKKEKIEMNIEDIIECEKTNKLFLFISFVFFTLFLSFYFVPYLYLDDINSSLKSIQDFNNSYWDSIVQMNSYSITLTEFKALTFSNNINEIYNAITKTGIGKDIYQYVSFLTYSIYFGIFVFASDLYFIGNKKNHTLNNTANFILVLFFLILLIIVSFIWSLKENNTTFLSLYSQTYFLMVLSFTAVFISFVIKRYSLMEANKLTKGTVKYSEKSYNKINTIYSEIRNEIKKITEDITNDDKLTTEAFDYAKTLNSKDFMKVTELFNVYNEKKKEEEKRRLLQNSIESKIKIHNKKTYEIENS